MSYAVKELFLTLQGEGAQAGRVAVFCRFTGCNLWSGREADRATGKGGCAAWCDTDFVGTDGDGGGRFADAKALADAAQALWGGRGGSALLVCTGGEPLLQLDTELIDAAHEAGFEVAIETNGTLPVPKGVDWVCVSPKAGSELVVRSGNEIKIVVPQEGVDPESFANLNFEHHFLQSKDSVHRDRDMQSTIAYCLAHPKWRLSVQSHKFIGIP